jgi:hypothetical protein
VRRNLTTQTPTPVLGFFLPAAKNLVATFTTSKTFLKNNLLVRKVFDTELRTTSENPKTEVAVEVVILN